MTRISYEGPGHELLYGGLVLKRGEPVEVTAEQAEDLLTLPRVRIVALPDEEGEPEAVAGEGHPKERKEGK